VDLGDAICLIVAQRVALDLTFSKLNILLVDGHASAQFLREESKHLEIDHCARYRLGIDLTERWVN